MARDFSLRSGLGACLVFAAVAGCQSEVKPPAAAPAQPVAEKPPEYLPESPLAEKPQQASTTDVAAAEKPVENTQTPAASTEPAPDAEKPSEPPPEVAGLPRLAKEYDVWLDAKNKRVYVGGQIVRTEGQLEMFACLKNSKEHESIVAANTKAVNVNAALIALGANPGGPVQFRPEFKPASGPEVEVTVIWTDKDGKRQNVRAQEWIRNLKTGKTLEQPWVFGGSGFWVDETTGERHFMAEDGDFICISNFTSAMLDLPVESSQATGDLMFEAMPDKIPPVGTPVLLVLTPKLKKYDAAKEPEKAAAQESETK